MRCSAVSLFAALGYPITITAFAMNSNDEDFHAGPMREFVTAVLRDPHSEGPVQWGFHTGSHDFPNAGKTETEHLKLTAGGGVQSIMLSQ